MITNSKAFKIIGRFSAAAARALEATAKARVQSTLLSMGPEWVEKYGYSYDSLRAGVNEWPWRQTSEKLIEEQQVKRSVKELNSYSDLELNELGIARNDIEFAVRHGHPENDYSLERQHEAA